MTGGALQVSSLSLGRSGRPVLRGVSFDVLPGEVVAIIGPNGAGKTTLLECLVGLRHVDAGTVSLDGRPLATLGDFAHAFAYMPDDAVLAEEVGVATLLAHARRFGGTSDSTASSLVADLGLSPLLGARAGGLSRGERRRVALFLALCADRPVLVLDEPFGAFDPLQLVSVLGSVRARARAGCAVVVSVHQMTDAEKIADRVLLLAEGRVVAFGARDALAAQAKRPGASLEAIFVALLEGTAAHARA